MPDQLAALPHVRVASDRGDRARYRSLPAGARFGIAPFRPGCPRSMPVADCPGMGLPVLAPRMGRFAEHGDPALHFTTTADASTPCAPSAPTPRTARTRPPSRPAT
ncbi:hypothetical protein OG413_25190 [Streptomyces sp. NBC_01433]|uniref:hypothetical protein n=1 Tax=Streptomyces sp. NBC_01433 TaxID=2903864 RepID=UPI00224DFD78|nr:hypothetical protein [Streptomyces sp. NBC_01433]MCX4678563.1 hypothetical protein [Streptomyces sp. NBC_01433]